MSTDVNVKADAAMTAAGVAAEPPVDPVQRKKARRMLVLLFAVCAAPAVAAYLMYFVVKPQGGTSAYGELIEPQRPIPTTLIARDDADGKPVPLSTLQGKWLMITADTAACDQNCVNKLFYMRQIRVLQGNERTRVETVWLLTNDAPVPAKLLEAYPDTRRLRVDPVALATWLPATGNTGLRDHIYLVDPLGNLMMAFPKNADPSKIKRDLARLLKWSGTG